MDVAQSLPGFDFDILASDFNIKDFPELTGISAETPIEQVHEPQGLPAIWPTSSRSMISPPPERRNFPKPQHERFKHVLHVVKVVGILEATLDEDHIPLDKTLQVNKAAIKTVLMIFEAEGHDPCKSCRALVPPAMDLIMHIYEKSLGGGCDVVPSRTPPQSLATVFRLGSYELEPDDQAVFRDMLIARELRRTCSTIESLSRRMRCAKEGPNCGSARWFAAMEKRLRKLIPSSPSV